MKRQAAIPTPYEDTKALYRTVMAMKELVECLAGQRGSLGDVAVTWQDLIDHGVIKPEQAPAALGSHRLQRTR